MKSRLKWGVSPRRHIRRQSRLLCGFTVCQKSEIEESIRNERNKIDFQNFQGKYDIDNYEIERFFNEEYEALGIEKREPLNNVLSGCRINLNIGEGVLDFIYAD